MKRFTRLFIRLDETNKTTDKLAALIDYFSAAPPRDAAWAVTYLTGKRPRSPVNAAQVRAWVQSAANIPEWLFTESLAYYIIRYGGFMHTSGLTVRREVAERAGPFREGYFYGSPSR